MGSPITFHDGIVVKKFLAIAEGATMSPTANSINASHVQSGADMLRESMKQEPQAVFPIPLVARRRHNALEQALPATGADPHIGLFTGDLATPASALLKTDNFGSVGSLQTRYARTLFALPLEYDAAETLTFRAAAQLDTAIADVSATLVVEAFKVTRDGLASADLVNTVAQSIQFTNWTDVSFDIEPATLSAGDVLDVRLVVKVHDAGTTTVRAEIAATEFLIDVRG